MPGLTVLLGRDCRTVLAQLGVDEGALLRRAGLPAHLLAQPAPRVSAAEYRRFWHALEDGTSLCSLTLSLAFAIPSDTFHPPIFASLVCPDLRTAMNRLAVYKRLVSPVRMQVEERPEGVFAGFEWEDPAVVLPRSLAASELAVLVRLARVGSGRRVRPIRVETRAPLGCDDAFLEFFGVQPVSGDSDGVVFAVEDTLLRFRPPADGSWLVTEDDVVEAVPASDEASVTDRVYRVLMETLPTGVAAIGTVAKRLGLGTRTLQRRLRSESTSYQHIVRETRYSLATHYLKNTTVSHAEIAFLVGFDETNSFFRAYRTWSGTTPEAVRRGDRVALCATGRQAMAPGSVPADPLSPAGG